MRHIDDLVSLSRRVLVSALSRAKESGAPFFAVDATAGNGHDTLFLADAVGEKGRVWAFDVQEVALAATRQLLEKNFPELLARVVLEHAGHETAANILPAVIAGKLHAVTFNLGYLPGGDKRRVTQPETTLEALAFFVEALAAGGVISIHAYQGHEGGHDEKNAVGRWLATLPWETWRVAEYAFHNKQWNRETLFLVEKLRKTSFLQRE